MDRFNDLEVDPAVIKRIKEFSHEVKYELFNIYKTWKEDAENVDKKEQIENDTESLNKKILNYDKKDFGKSLIFENPTMIDHKAALKRQKKLTTTTVRVRVSDIKCGRCQSKKTMINPVQTRSGDEGYSWLCKCIACNYSWMKSD